MKYKYYLYLFISIYFLAACAGPKVDTSKCNKFKKTSKDYINCMNKVISSTNTAKNMREFKKHKTMKSFFEQVEVTVSD